MSSLLEVKDLKTYFFMPDAVVKAVDGISYEINEGEIVGVVGESGSGKSVSAMSVMRLIASPPGRIVNGEVIFEGDNLVAMDEDEIRKVRGNDIAMIFQEPMTSLNPAYTIGNQMEETLIRHRKASREEARDRAVFLLEKVGITAARSRLRQYPHQLSGGLRQRVMIAMTLMCGPDLIIADEPTTALDVTIQAQILLLLAELQKEFNMGLILITHDLGVVARVADRVAVMYAGQIVEQGSAKQVFENPTHPYTQGLLECIPIPGKTARGSHLGSIPGIVPSLIGEMNCCHFAERCSYASNPCHSAVVDLRPGFTNAHDYRCVMSPEQCADNLKQKVPA